MNLDLLLGAIQTSGANEDKQVVHQAQREADKITQDAQKIVTANRQLWWREQQEAERLDATRTLSKANRTSTYSAVDVKQQAVEAVLVAAQAELKALLQSGQRSGVIENLCREVLTVVTLPGLIRMHPGDQRIVQKLLVGKTAPALRVIPDESVEDGLIYASDDGKVIIDNTFAARLERVKPVLLEQIAVTLFG